MAATAINPAILQWARETAGLSLEDAAAKLHLPAAAADSPAARLQGMEEGTEPPTRAMLGNMARHYRRPLTTFYLAGPPRVTPRGSDFRTLSQHDPRQDALVDTLLREMRARQATVRSTLELEDEARDLTYVGSAGTGTEVDILSAEIARVLQFSLDEFRSHPDALKAFSYLRDKVEQIGVFVVLAGDLGTHHSEIDVELFRGFAIADRVAPFIVINDRDSRPALSFTLLHELTHIWLGQTAISGGAPDRDVERFCNDVASEILLKEAELREVRWPAAEEGAEALQRSVTAFARERNVSSSMVAYKLYRADLISRTQWSTQLRRYRQLWLEARRKARERRSAKSGGPPFYSTRRQKLGAALLSFADRMHQAGALSTGEAAQLLGVAPRQVQLLLAAT